MAADIWTFSHLTQLPPTDADRGLIAEARRLADAAGGATVTAVVATPADISAPDLGVLAASGADRVQHCRYAALAGCPDELFAHALHAWFGDAPPLCLLMVHDAQCAALAARLGALLGSAVLTGVVDAVLDPGACLRVMRPLHNGQLYEAVAAETSPTAVMTFAPDLLVPPDRPCSSEPAPVVAIRIETGPQDLKTSILRTISAETGDLALAEADVVVAGGRGAGRGGDFDRLHELARVLGGVVAGTRPVVDAQLLPFDYQIGQTGKNIAPRLLINCGISGANEYTAGIEGARQVIAINTDRQAPIFRWADLGLVGEVQQVLPVLLDCLKAIKK